PYTTLFRSLDLLDRRPIALVVVGIHAGDAPEERAACGIAGLRHRRRVARVVGGDVIDLRAEVRRRCDLHAVVLDADPRVPAEQDVVDAAVRLEIDRLADRPR